eukprot:2624820-Lingulodinium_polyedra.AAC.1
MKQELAVSNRRLSVATRVAQKLSDSGCLGHVQENRGELIHIFPGGQAEIFIAQPMKDQPIETQQT